MIDNFDEYFLRRYLLGELAEDEQIAIEDRVFTDAELRSLLDAAEQDLIDEYAADQLGNQERERFEKMFFNSAARRERIGFAQALAQIPLPKIVDKSQPATQSKPGFWQSFFNFSFAPQIAVAAAILIVVAGGWWFLLSRQSSNPEIVGEIGNQSARQTETPAPSVTLEMSPATVSNSNVTNTTSPTNARGEVSQNSNNNRQNVRANKNNANSSASPAIKKRNNTSAAATTFAALVFPPLSTRGQNNSKLRLDIQPNVKNVRLIFNLEKGDEFPRYNIRIVAANGEKILSSQATRRNLTLALTAAAQQFADGSYTATVTGLRPAGQPETIGYYDFTVRRRP